MLIPSIDLQRGRVVQLVQGERLALESDDVFGWVKKFERFPVVQLIDLDAAMGVSDNLELVKRIAAVLPCRVGGGVRSSDRARELVAAGARTVIAGSALFTETGVNLEAAARLATAVGVDRLIGAVDSRDGRIVVRGWRSAVGLAPADAVRALEPFCGGFLYTHVDTEGLMRGIDMTAVCAVHAATTRRLSAAGGITTAEEIEALDRLGIDAVVGMALYTGLLDIRPPA